MGIGDNVFWKLRDRLARIIPTNRKLSLIKENILSNIKKRSKNKMQFNIRNGRFYKKENLLGSFMKNFAKVGSTAETCPMPLSMDVWNGLKCPYQCVYCYSDNMKNAFLPAYFDNCGETISRSGSFDFYKREIDKMMVSRGKNPLELFGKRKRAIAKEMPFRLGVTYEDFSKLEKRKRISLDVLRYFKEIAYPVMINTKSDLLGTDEYLDVLTKGRSKIAVVASIISSNEELLKKLEPGAPSFKERIASCKRLVEAGIRVVLRISPSLFFITDSLPDVVGLIEGAKSAGIKHITFDILTDSSKEPVIKNKFSRIGLDYDRSLIVSGEAYAVSSYLKLLFMKMFREEGFNCSANDVGNILANDQFNCCSIGDWFDDDSFNWGSIRGAVRYIAEQKGALAGWLGFKQWVDKKGGFLSEDIEKDVQVLWNGDTGNASVCHTAGIIPCGRDGYGALWKVGDKNDWRKDIVEGVLREII